MIKLGVINTDKNSSSPLVSVIIPVFNGVEFLDEALASIAKQTYPHFECIMVNDCSTDDSVAIMSSWVQQDHRFKLITNSHNLGESATANVGFQASRGEYLARMDQDDIALPTRLEKQVAFLNTHPDHIVVGTQADIIDEQGKVVGHKLFPTDHTTIFAEYGNFHPMLHPSIMVRRSLLPSQNQLWTDSLPAADDYMTLYTLLMAGKFANLDEKLMQYRLHSSNNSMKHMKWKFLKSLQVRFTAVRELHYPLSMKMVLLMIIQSIYVLLLPEWLSVGTYLVLKGMKPFNQAFPLVSKIFPRLS